MSNENLTMPPKTRIVGNKELIDIFTEIFTAEEESFGKKDYSKPEYLYAFLAMIISDEETYKRSESSQTMLALSNGAEDYQLNGYDLFNKYIKYYLGDRKQRSKPYKYDISQLDPNRKIYQYKDGSRPSDELVIAFAVTLHKRGFFRAAIEMYDKYVADQDSPRSIDAILARYYKAIANNGCKSTAEQKTASVGPDVKELKTDIYKAISTNPEMEKLFDAVTDVYTYQKEYFKYDVAIKDKIATCPDFNSENLPAIKQVYQEINDDIARITNPAVVEQLNENYGRDIAKIKEGIVKQEFSDEFGYHDKIINDCILTCPAFNVSNIDKIVEAKKHIDEAISRIETKEVKQAIENKYSKNIEAISQAIIDLNYRKWYEHYDAEISKKITTHPAYSTKNIKEIVALNEDIQRTLKGINNSTLKNNIAGKYEKEISELSEMTEVLSNADALLSKYYGSSTNVRKIWNYMCSEFGYHEGKYNGNTIIDITPLESIKNLIDKLLSYSSYAGDKKNLYTSLSRQLKEEVNIEINNCAQNNAYYDKHKKTSQPAKKKKKGGLKKLFKFLIDIVPVILFVLLVVANGLYMVGYKPNHLQSFCLRLIGFGGLLALIWYALILYMLIRYFINMYGHKHYSNFGRIVMLIASILLALVGLYSLLNAGCYSCEISCAPSLSYSGWMGLVSIVVGGLMIWATSEEGY